MRNSFILEKLYLFFKFNQIVYPFLRRNLKVKTVLKSQYVTTCNKSVYIYLHWLHDVHWHPVKPQICNTDWRTWHGFFPQSPPWPTHAIKNSSESLNATRHIFYSCVRGMVLTIHMIPNILHCSYQFTVIQILVPLKLDSLPNYFALNSRHWYNIQ